MGKAQKLKKSGDKEIVNWLKMSDETFKEYFKRIIKQISWFGTISILLGVPGFIVACITLADKCSSEPANFIKINENIREETKPDETITSQKQILLDSLKTNTALIINTFNPEMIPEKLDSVRGRNILLIRNFKLLSIEFANYVSEYAQEIPVISVEDKDYEEIKAMTNASYQKTEDIWFTMDSLLTIIMELNDYGLTYHVSSYIVNPNAYGELQLMEKKIEKIRHGILSESKIIENMMSQKAEMEGDIFYKDFKEDLSKYLQLNHDFMYSFELQKFRNKLLSFLIIQNSNYEVPLKKYMLGYSKEIK